MTRSEKFWKQHGANYKLHDAIKLLRQAATEFDEAGYWGVAIVVRKLLEHADWASRSAGGAHAHASRGMWPDGGDEEAA